MQMILQATWPSSSPGSLLGPSRCARYACSLTFGVKWRWFFWRHVLYAPLFSALLRVVGRAG